MYEVVKLVTFTVSVGFPGFGTRKPADSDPPTFPPLTSNLKLNVWVSCFFNVILYPKFGLLPVKASVPPVITTGAVMPILAPTLQVLY